MSFMWIHALSYVVTVRGQTSCRPSPSTPASTPSPFRMRRCHWYMRSRSGATTSAGAACRAMIESAISVFPVPVGLTITPRPPARSQASIAASWSGRSRGSAGRSNGAGKKRAARSSRWRR